MNKFKYALMALPLALLGACSAEEGTEPGTDKTPEVTVYTYDVVDPSLNPDNDVWVRFATNSAAREVYYLVEKESDVEAFVNANGEQAYINKVVETGTKFTVEGAQNVDVNITDIHGDCVISAVAYNGATGKRGKAYFTGLDWSDVVEGTFYIQQAFISTQSTFATLQVCDQDETLYRVENAFGEGYSVKMQMLKVKGKDPDQPDGTPGDVYTLFRIPEAKTPFAVRLSSTPDPQALWVQDIGYWQNNASFVTSVSGYENGMYEDYSAFFQFAWMAGSIGCVSFETPSWFIPFDN